MELKHRRLEKGWSQEQLADITGLSARTVQRLEKGEKPSLETLKALAAGFKISSSELQKDFNAIKQPDNMTIAESKFMTREWRSFFIHLITFMVVMTWAYILSAQFELDNEWVGIVMLSWGGLLVVHAIKNIGSAEPE
ncbi:MAG: helix-turn-helix domain-containing protein [Rhizobiales bacterium]|nr:helix-turn-helix domain-containing protein [Hyphomicrobiales bacterium]NRB15527.1 helix-turn-helix domain-containing protein [Hyphomicrobiales bacterium]